MKELDGLKNLQWLGLDPRAVTDTGLQSLREIGLLYALDRAVAKDGKRPATAEDVLSLDLSTTEVTNAGLKELKGLKNLQVLNLGSRNVTDAGLNDLKDLNNLQMLYLPSGGVTDAGIADLKKALPNVQIKWGLPWLPPIRLGEDH